MAPIDLSTFGLRAVDCIFPAIIAIIGSCCIAKCSRRTWMTIDAGLLAFAFLQCYIYPAFWFRFGVEGEIQAHHVCVSRVVSTAAIACALLIWLTRDCADHTVPVSILTSRIVALLAAIPVLCYTWYRDTLKQGDALAFRPEALLVNLSIGTVLLFGHMRHLFRSEYYAGYSQRSTRVNLHLRIDFFILVILGATLLGLPDMMFDIFIGFGRRDALSIYLLKITGCLCLGAAFQALEATGYMYYEDKRHFFHSRTIALVLLILAEIYTFLGVVWQPATLLFNLCVSVPWLINCKLACNDIRAFLDVTRKEQ